MSIATPVKESNTAGLTSAWEYPQIKTYNRQLSMAAMCGVKNGYTMSEVHGEIREEIEKMNLPQGYSFFWDSQYKDQTEGLQALVKFFPLAFLMLVVILVALFSNFRQPIIILCVLPLSLIGVAIGMLLTGFDFGFFPIAGWLGLLGMIIKNVIVLLDEINTQRRNGISPYDSIIEATISNFLFHGLVVSRCFQVLVVFQDFFPILRLIIAVLCD